MLGPNSQKQTQPTRFSGISTLYGSECGSTETKFFLTLEVENSSQRCMEGTCTFDYLFTTFLKNHVFGIFVSLLSKIDLFTKFQFMIDLIESWNLDCLTHTRNLHSREIKLNCIKKSTFICNFCPMDGVESSNIKLESGLQIPKSFWNFS